MPAGKVYCHAATVVILFALSRL